MNRKIKICISPLVLAALVMIFLSSCKKEEQKENPEEIPEDVNFTLTDIDGNGYHTITIGTQVWMVENLKVTKFNDGTPIPTGHADVEWDNLQTPDYCWYNNEAKYKKTFGAIYNWYAVSTGKLAPKGWHVPSDTEWTTLENYLIANGYNYDGTTKENKCAKSLAAATNWQPNSCSGAVGNTDYPSFRNKTGFTAFPSGIRGSMGKYYFSADAACWWSSSKAEGTPNPQDPELNAWCRRLFNYSTEIFRSYVAKTNGLSVRCIKD